MHFLNRMEKKFGKYAIPNLTRYILATYVAGYILSAFGQLGGGGVLDKLTLSVSLILRGQVWRIVSWILIPPSGLSIFTVFMLFFYFSIGTQLERTWGDFLYNVYIFSGLILTIIGAFVLYAFTRPFDYGALFSTYYISMSLILGFAMTYPDYQIYFYFIIPLKMKWLAVIDLAFLAYEVISYGRRGYLLPILVVVGCSLANVLIFFLLTRKNKRLSAAGRTRGNPSRTMHSPGSRTGSGSLQAHHRCAVCGRTELDNPDLEFRYCTKCKGYYEYCQDHLFTHTHKQ